MLELMVAVAVSAVLLTIGIPSFMRMVADNQRVSYTADIYGAFSFARSEAIARNLQVVICKSTDEATCNNAADWSDGWIVYANLDNNTGGSEPDAPNEQVLQSHPAVERFTLESSDLPTRVVFLPTGRALNIGDFELCPDNDALAGRTIQITSTGRARTAALDCDTSAEGS